MKNAWIVGVRPKSIFFRETLAVKRRQQIVFAANGTAVAVSQLEMAMFLCSAG